MRRFPIAYLRLLCALLCAALAAGCALAPIADEGAAPPPFELSGRVLVRYRNQAFSSSLRWQQSAAGDDIWLTAPLGQTIAHLEASLTGATLTAADQKQYHASSIESLTRSALGWGFPVAGLRYWVRGTSAPTPAAGNVERDDRSRAVRFQQGDWLVSFSYSNAEVVLPMRVDAASADANIRLVIDSLTETDVAP